MPIVCMFGLYVLGIMSIIRANFLYIDDMGRAIIGNRGWGHFSRYITEWNPVIKRLVPLNLGTDWDWGNVYLTGHYRFNLQQDASIEDTGLETMFDSYYHTIKSDGKRVLVILK